MNAHEAPARESTDARQQLRALDARRGRGVDGDFELCGDYGELAGHLDPRRTDDLERVDWLLDRMYGLDHTFVDVMRGVEDTGAPLATKLMARLYVARVAAARDDFEVSDPLFRSVLRGARAAGPLVEAAACTEYTRQCAFEERVFEALVLTRHAASIYGRESRPGEMAIVQTDLCWARSELGKWNEAEQAATTAVALSAALPTPVRQKLVLLNRVHLASNALLQGHPDRALQLTDELEEMAGDESKTPNKVRWFGGFRADIHAKAGRYEESLRHIDAIRHLIAGDRASFYVEGIEARCLAGLGQTEEARARIEPLFDRLENGRQLLGARGWIDQALTFAEVLADPIGDAAASKRAYDIAATAMLARIVELDRAAEEIPQLGFTRPQDVAVLADSRWRFTKQQERMTDAVRRLLESASCDGSGRLVSSLDTGALGRICAWCGKVSGPEGRWLPIAQYLPKDEERRLTHDVCPTCRKSVVASSFGSV